MRAFILGLSLLAGACTSTIQTETTHPVRQPVVAARANEPVRAIEGHGGRDPLAYRCGDTVLADQSTSGGERLQLSQPCFDPQEEAAQAPRALPANEQARVPNEVQRASGGLVETELVACRNIPERELAHSPFAHHKAISEVIPHYAGGTVRGARVVFKKIPGMTEAWMRQDIACHQARFASRSDSASYMPEDPSMIAGTRVTVESDRATVTVLIEATTDEAGREVLARARALIAAPATALR